jgi:GNAT superfamily N-acetyltransferase
MWFRQSSGEFSAGKGAGNRRALQRLVRSGVPIGVLAYVGDEPAGWCAVAPRGHYPRLARSRVLAPVDERPAWSVTCFFVSRRFRRQGVTARLLEAAVRFAAERGATLVEGYPVEPRGGKTADVFAYTGIASVFRAAGFREAARRSATRPVMRLELKPARGPAPNPSALRPRRTVARGDARSAARPIITRGDASGAARLNPARGSARG